MDPSILSMLGVYIITWTISMDPNILSMILLLN